MKKGHIHPHQNYMQCIIIHYTLVSGPGSSVGIATEYGLDVPGIESRWRRYFPPIQTGSGAHPASCTMGTGSFPGVKSGRGVTLTTHPLLESWSWKGRAIPLPTLWATPKPVMGTLYPYTFVASPGKSTLKSRRMKFAHG